MKSPARFLLYLILPFFAGTGLAQEKRAEVPDWLTGREGVKAGVLTVPENHGDPEGRKIGIAYAVIERRNKDSKEYPMILFSGGPGERSLVPGLIDFLKGHPFLQDRDFILFDQRGIGYSSPLPDMSYDTFLVMAADAGPERERHLMDSVILEFAHRCSVEGIHPEYYNTLQNARDVGMLFRHLGYEKYNLFGGSYGTRLGRMVQDLFPEYVHASILDSPSPLQGDFLISRLQSYNLSLERIFEYCEGNPDCRQQYPRLKETYFQAIAGLEENPIHTKVNDSLDFVINPQDGIYLLRRLLYMGNAREKAPEMIRALKEGAGPVIQEVLGFEAQITGALNMSMLLSVEKFENFDPDTSEKTIEEAYSKYPLIPVTMGYFDAIYRAGAHWHAGSLPPEERHFKKSEIPTLIFVNQYDPVTPPAYGHLFKRNLPNGHLLILDEGGHGQGNRECKERVMMEFMNAPDRMPDVSCLNLFEE